MPVSSPSCPPFPIDLFTFEATMRPNFFEPALKKFYFVQSLAIIYLFLHITSRTYSQTLGVFFPSQLDMMSIFIFPSSNFVV